jgi:hypothetical protein
VTNGNGNRRCDNLLATLPLFEIAIVLLRLDYTNLAAEWWSTVGQLIEGMAVIIPNDEKLVAQLTSRRKQYDSKGREKLESKADLRARGVESPDRADALIGAIILGQESQIDWKCIHFFLNHRPFLKFPERQKALHSLLLPDNF